MNDPTEPDAFEITSIEATEFYRVLGRALWALGAFEYQLVFCIVIVLRTAQTEEDAERELLRAFSFTLGNLLREFRKYRDPVPNLDARLDRFKEERDWLCHRIYRQNHHAMLNRDRFRALLHRLHTFHDDAHSLMQILDGMFDRWLEGQGVSPDELNIKIAQRLADWKHAPPEF